MNTFFVILESIVDYNKPRKRNSNLESPILCFFRGVTLEIF